MNFQKNFTHSSYGILAIPNDPISTPDVGVIILVNPSPNWNAMMVDWREISIRSENGIMIGIVSAAFAEPEGMIRFNPVCMTYMIPNDHVLPTS